MLVNKIIYKYFAGEGEAFESEVAERGVIPDLVSYMTPTGAAEQSERSEIVIYATGELSFPDDKKELRGNFWFIIILYYYIILYYIILIYIL